MLGCPNSGVPPDNPNLPCATKHAGGTTRNEDHPFNRLHFGSLLLHRIRADPPPRQSRAHDRPEVH